MFDVERLKTQDGYDATELIGQIVWYLDGSRLCSFTLSHIELAHDVRLIDDEESVWLAVSDCRAQPGEWATTYYEERAKLITAEAKKAGLDLQWTVNHDQQRDRLPAAETGKG